MNIRGSLVDTPFGGAPVEYDTGVFAQRGNIGTHVRDKFGMIPQFGAKIGFRVTRRLSLTAGYTLVYWSSVVRPGQHYSLDVNQDLIENNGAFVGPLRPAFKWNDSDYWAQGANVGLAFDW